MKRIWLVLALFTGLAQAAHLHSAVYDASRDELELDLTYGGCGLESFKLEFGPCMETFPAQIKATLDDSQDICRGLVRTRLRLSVKEMQGCRPAVMSLSTRNGQPLSVEIPASGPDVSVVKATRQADPIRVDSVTTIIEGEFGFPQVHVYAKATFSNSCRVPTSKELITIPQYEDNYRFLNLSVGNESRRMCPAVYKPVTVTVDLGVYTKPTDGLFSKIVVNGKEAR